MSSSPSSSSTSTSPTSSNPLPSAAKTSQTASQTSQTESQTSQTASQKSQTSGSSHSTGTASTSDSSTTKGLKILGLLVILGLVIWGIVAWAGGCDNHGDKCGYDGYSGNDEPAAKCSNSAPTGTCTSGTCAKDAFGNYGCFPPCATAGNCAAGLDCYNKVCIVGPCGVQYPNGTCANGQVCIPLNIEGTSFKCGTACSSSTICSPTGTICSTAATGNNKGCIFPASPSGPSGSFTVTPQVRKYSSFDMVGSYDNYVTFVPNTQSQFMGVSERVNLPFYTGIREPVNLTINVSVQSVDPAAETWLFYGTNRVYKIPSQPGNYGPIRYSTADLNKAFVVMSDKKTRITGSINFTGS